MTKILAVDDEPDMELLLRRRFRRRIREGELEFSFAHDGLEAIERLEDEPETDVLLTDINMPRLDGLQLLSRLHDSMPITKAIVISAYGDMTNIRRAMNSGAYDFVTKPIDLDDLEVTLNKTLDEVERVKATLKAIRENDILKMYVDGDVLDFMTKHQFQERLLVNETVDATIMFIDLCGFTRISETMAADRVVALLNQLFDLIVPQIIAQDGAVDKFIGDAVMTLFRGDHHLDRALEAAIAVRDRMDKWAESAGSEDMRQVRVSIGVNSGEMVSGNIGSESLYRLDFTVIGDVVNTAAHYQKVATENQIIIGEDLHERIKQSFSCECIGTHELKNKAGPVVLYNVLR